MAIWTTSWQENIKNWLTCPFVPVELKNLESLFTNTATDDAKNINWQELATNIEKIDTNLTKLNTLSAKTQEHLQDAFMTPLEFGTAGLRGKMGTGINRMNIYTIATATQGVAQWLLHKFGVKKCSESVVVIGYDTRHNSQLFAEVTAAVLAANGIAVEIFSDYCQTPMLAFAIRPLEALAGIMVTASHNPSIYNGYKLYGADGIQVGQEDVDIIAQNITAEYIAVDFKQAVQNQLITYVSPTIEHSYIEKTVHLINPAPYPDKVKIAYTAMHGTGAKLIKSLFRIGGFSDLITVAEQIEPNPDFPTAPAPNPEFPKATTLLKELAIASQADIALATDPDADRLAVIIPDDQGEYHQLTGNQTAAFLLDYWLKYLIKENKLPKNPAIVKSIVTADLGKSIASMYNVHTEESLTGFKDICGKIREFTANDSFNYVMGYEESIGYAIGQNVLDKDGCSAAYIFAHAAATYKSEGRTLWQIWQEIGHTHGFLGETTLNLVREGQSGKEFMQYITGKFRLQAPLHLAGSELAYFEDYKSSYKGEIIQDGQTRQVNHLGPINLRSSNVMRFHFKDGSWYAIRPSGTEPKLKVYIYATADNQTTASAKSDQMTAELEVIIAKMEDDFHKLNAAKF